jgi:hypothetical protein
MNDITRAIVIATIAGLLADWLKKRFLSGNE